VVDTWERFGHLAAAPIGAQPRPPHNRKKPAMKFDLKTPGLCLAVSLGLGCGDGKWGKENELSGSWSGSVYFESGSRRTGLSLRLDSGSVVGGEEDMGIIRLSNLAGEYFFDGSKVMVDFSNSSPDLCGTSDGTSMSGFTCDNKGNDEGGTFSLSR
jgi:hypothetical protein